MLGSLGGVIALVFLVFRSDLNTLEFCGILLAASIALARPNWGNRAFSRIEGCLAVLARHRVLAVGLVGVLAMVLRLSILPIAPIPEPVVSDEFSHRLLGETLALGRLSNPTHPMWAHLETIHVIQKPTYASMYLPGQGLFLALGIVLTGIAWIGVLFTAALLSMAICWALQGWLPPGWALFGGLLAVLRFGLFSYWVNSYWGGAVGAIGGALVIGSWPRIRRRTRVAPALLLALGLVLLAITRPFEGLIVCVPVAVAMGAWLNRLKASERRMAARRIVLPIASVLLLAGAGLAYYNLRVTGEALRVPYTVNQQTYGWPLTLPWFQPQPRTHATQAMHDYYLSEVRLHEKLSNFKDHLVLNFSDGVMLWTFFVGPALTVFLAFLPRVLRDRRIRLPLAMVAAGVAALAIEQSRYPHYFAPATAALFILLLQAARHMRAAGERSRPALLALLRYVPVIAVLVVSARAAVPALRSRDSAMGHYLSWCCGKPGNLERARIVSDLTRTPGQHLILVSYGPQHSPMYEWVYNEPDIDRAKVVWAREMGPAADQELLQYFSNRQVWRLTVNDDSQPPTLQPTTERAAR